MPSPTGDGLPKPLPSSPNVAGGVVLINADVLCTISTPALESEAEYQPKRDVAVGFPIPTLSLQEEAVKDFCFPAAEGASLKPFYSLRCASWSRLYATL